jgi:hypothetical protein
MPEWLSVALGIVGGIALVVGAIYLAIRPYVAARPPKRRFPDPTEARDGYEAANLGDSWVGHDASSGGDGASH